MVSTALRKMSCSSIGYTWLNASRLGCSHHNNTHSKVVLLATNMPLVAMVYAVRDAGADPCMVRIGTGTPLLTDKSCKFSLFLGYFGVISATQPPLLDLGLPFLHILDPPLGMSVTCQLSRTGACQLETRQSYGFRNLLLHLSNTHFYQSPNDQTNQKGAQH